jgi:hypothetical protein
MAAKLDHMDDTYSQAMASRREVRRRSHDTAAWVGACVLGALTVAALVPPAFFRLAIASPHQYGLAGEPCQPRGGGLDSHADSPRPSWRCRLFRADNVAVPRRPLSVAQRARTMAVGAFLASLMLTIGGLVWMISHAAFTL